MGARQLAACVAVLLLGPLAAADVPADPLTPEERAWIEAHGPVRHAPDPNYPPFEFYDEDGRLVGINADLVNRMSRNLDVEFETVRVANWSAALDALRAGDVDVLGALAANPEREAWMDFTAPYAALGEVFYVADPALTDEGQLAGKRVGVVKDYAAAAWLAENRPHLTLVTVPDTLTGLNMLSRGELDAFFENVPVAGYYIRTTSLLNIRVMGEPLYYSPVQWSVGEGNAVLLSILEKGLASVSPGESARVFEYWTGSDISVPAPAGQGFSAVERNVVVGVLVVAVATGAWGVSLRSTVKRRTGELVASKRDLEELNRDLEGRVEARTRDLERANRDLEAFSYTLSHDLRSPLTAIASYDELLRNKYADRLDDEGRRYVDRIGAAAVRMGQLIEDILRFSRASQTPLERTRVDLSALARDILRALAEREPDRRVETRIEPGLEAEGDPRLVRVALENLLQNAWKYTRGRDTAVVEFGAEGGAFYVRDNGAGFDPAESSRLFQAFQRLHDPAQFEGTGIGLFTVERVVARHGGRVWAEGAVDRGATFRFTLRGGDA